jgi:hypothetical protein
MSYDIEVWAPLEPDVASLLTETGWTPSGSGWAFAGRAWQVVVMPPDSVEPEDVPHEIAGAVPGVSHLVSISLEPISAPAPGMKQLLKTVSAIAKAGHGAVLDRQTDEVRLPSGVKRFATAAREERFSVIAMSWWFNDGPLLTGAGLEAFVGALQRSLPEALPKRYGLHEPPQHKYAETGRDHFLRFLQENGRQVVVWYPSRPVAGVSLQLRDDWGVHPKAGWRSNLVTVEVEEAALAQPGWSTQLVRTWRALSKVIRPYYGEVRTRRGLIRSGATYGLDSKTQQAPVRGSMWRGIPREARHAIVVADPYSVLWPGLTKAGDADDGLVFVTKPAWSGDDDVAAVAGGVPKKLLQKGTYGWVRHPSGGMTLEGPTEYPDIWPFDR